MKILRVVLVFIAICLLGNATPVRALDTVPYNPPPELTTSPLIITGYALAAGLPTYVQLFNTGNIPVDITDWRLAYSSVEQPEPLLDMTLSGWIAPTNYLMAGDTATIANADFSYALTTPSGTITPLKLQLLPPTGTLIAPHEVSALKDGIYERNKSTSTGKYLTTFSSLGEPADLYGGGFYDFADTTALQFSEILANPRNCSPVETSADCSDYVKLYNPTDQSIDLAAFRLRMGYQNQTATASNTYTLTGTVDPSHYVVVSVSADGRPLSITNSGGFVWLEDTYGLQRYDSSVQAYEDASADSKKGQAWAYDVSDGTWKWTTQPTPADAPSIFPTPPPVPVTPSPVVTALAPCQAGQYRSPDTNRCRLIVTATASALMPCKDGQYRSEETNRCRSIVAASASLQPCADDQFRNPATGRCKKIASTDDVALVDCGEGRERNPETNRCRNVAATSVPKAAFAVEPMKETGTAFVGWWALGGVLALALGYGAWEWRQEMLAGIRKVGTFFSAQK